MVLFLRCVRAPAADPRTANLTPPTPAGIIADHLATGNALDRHLTLYPLCIILPVITANRR